jgi:hypothetical protein
MNKSLMRISLWLVGLLLWSPIPAARATTAVEMTFADLVSHAEVIAVGTVTDIHEQWDATQKVPLTLVTFSNLTVLKGNPGNSMTLEFVGGTMPNGLVMAISGVPHFAVGEKTVVFSTGNHKDFCPLTGLWQGLFRVTANPQLGVETVSDSTHVPLTQIQNGRVMKYSTGGTTQETLALPDFIQAIHTELQKSGNPS